MCRQGLVILIVIFIFILFLWLVSIGEARGECQRRQCCSTLSTLVEPVSYLADPDPMTLTIVYRSRGAAARLLMGTKKLDHITPVLKSIHWLPVEKRINFKVLLLVCHALHDQAPEYIRDMLQERTNVRILHDSVQPVSISSDQSQRLCGLCFYYCCPETVECSARIYH